MPPTADLLDLRALTFRNPWATMVTHFGKRIENRFWPAPAGRDRFLVHAGKDWDDSEFANDWRYSLFPVTTSALVAAAAIVGCCGRSRWTVDLQCGCDPVWAQPGQFHWQLADVHVFAQPITYPRGWLGMWRVNPDVLDQVAEQLQTAQVR